ncbi:hypothetical protein FOCG_18417 [Fusarium oxysporum f. sp. radicis-lycopersici 26381]|nr:hypothetical protein FOCG_18417 [Fusarium oxysporum f. sp. radicis-lycopersici 26381]
MESNLVKTMEINLLRTLRPDLGKRIQITLVRSMAINQLTKTHFYLDSSSVKWIKTTQPTMPGLSVQ